MEVGAAAVLVNTAIAVAADPALMAEAFALATRAGRMGFLAGRGAVRDSAQASAPLTASWFAPLYLGNACLSSCTCCGFSKGLDVARRTLTVDEVLAEARVLAEQGFQHLMLVAGEHRLEVSADYLVACVEALRPYVPSISVETQTWSDDTYARLVAAGLEGAVHHQETYDRERYAQTHVAGWKRDVDRRLSSTERAAESGVRRLGIGALRLAAPEAGIVLSTREPAALRAGLARIAVTSMSAGSSTEPGGYLTPGTAQEQFAVSDERSPAEVAAMLEAAGYEPVWKDETPLRSSSIRARSGQDIARLRRNLPPCS